MVISRLAPAGMQALYIQEHKIIVFFLKFLRYLVTMVNLSHSSSPAFLLAVYTQVKHQANAVMWSQSPNCDPNQYMGLGFGQTP